MGGIPQIQNTVIPQMMKNGQYQNKLNQIKING